MTTLIDQEARQRFIQEVEQPFSVIAPAGVGKTFSIVERVARALQETPHPIALVTYTKKAAEQMRQRLEARLKKTPQHLSSERIFIGTIHALCAQLMRKNAIDWELPAAQEIFADPEALWGVYQEAVPHPLQDLGETEVSLYLSYFGRFPVPLLLSLPMAPLAPHPGDPPVLQLSKLFAASFRGPTQKTYERLASWARRFVEIAGTPGYIMPELPEPPKEDSPLAPLYEEVFGPLQAWRARAGFFYAQHLAQGFRRWRLAQGAYLYDDLIEIVLTKTSVGSLSIVLDEAQDTSASQLALLKKLALVIDGRRQLTMVGDPQQSIYASRASLPEYLRLHRQLIEEDAAQELTFQVTFRCSQSVVGCVNTLGPLLLPGGGTQAQFVPLFARPQATLGSVSRLSLPEGFIPPEEDLEYRDIQATSALAQALQSILPRGYPLHQIAILAPRREWLFRLEAALLQAGFRTQVHADSPTPAPAQRLMQGLLHMLLHPTDSFQLVGLLREISPVSDLTLAQAAQSFPQLFSLLPGTDFTALPADLGSELQALGAAWLATQGLPLPAAIETFLRVARMDERVAAIDEALAGQLWPAWVAYRFQVLAQAAHSATLQALLSALQGPAAAQPVEPGALQLMTLHKAKGLEWPVVILPFLYRPLPPARPSYPAAHPTLAQALSWKLPASTSALAEEENARRLYYVALTRPKDHLILVDDAAFYPPQRTSPAVYLGIAPGGAHAAFFQSLSTPTPFAPCLVSPAPAPTQPSVTPAATPRPVLAPSSLAHTGASLVAPAASGVHYGEAWHALCHHLFLHPADRWESLLAAQLVGHPHAARLQAEFALLRASPTWRLLTPSVHRLQAEVPFLAELPQGIFEGRADLVIETPDDIIVIDWKTDRLEAEKLLPIYQPQLAVYAQAFRQLYRRPVRVFLYSTPHGQLLSLQD